MIKDYKLQLEEFYEQWRYLNWNNKKEKTKLLGKIDTLTDFLEESESVFVAQTQIRIAYSALMEEYQIAEKYFLKVVEKEEQFANNPDILETTYQGLADLYFETKQYDKSSNIYIKLLKINELEDLIEEDILQMGIAMVNGSKGLYHNKAEELLLFVYNSDVCDEEMDHLMATKANYYLGLARFKLKNYKEAKLYLKNAIILYKQRKWDCENIYQLLNNISDTFEVKPHSA